MYWVGNEKFILKQNMDGEIQKNQNNFFSKTLFNVMMSIIIQVY